jgi:hypothetical protein
MLKKISKSNLEDNGSQDYVKLELFDYDWMTYNLQAELHTDNQGVLKIEFKYYGATETAMTVKQMIDGEVKKYEYRYDYRIFENHIKKYIIKHLAFWQKEEGFNGIENVIDFYNEVLDKGSVCELDGFLEE